MVGILTGDIINSRGSSADTWLPALKQALSSASESKGWEIYRGDSFQAQLKPEDTLLKAIYIKSCIKTIKSLDVRLAIGIGDKDFSSSKLSESNGEAFIYSGEKLDALKEERVTLAVQTPWPDFNQEINISIRLALIVMDNWSPISAEMVKLTIEKPGVSQKELAEITKKSQSSVSEALKRARFAEISELELLYRKKINTLIDAK